MLNYINKYILPIFIYKRRPGPDPWPRQMVFKCPEKSLSHHYRFLLLRLEAIFSYTVIANRPFFSNKLIRDLRIITLALEVPIY